MRLIATPLSHYSRKVRILLDLYGFPYEFVDVGNVADAPLDQFGNNPLLRVPVLEDGATWLIESDHIASYLARKHDPKDRYEVHTVNAFDLNARAVMNGIMYEEVDIIIAKRMQVPIEKYAYFDKAYEAILNGLNWLESHGDQFDLVSPKYKEFHLTCIWDHLSYYDLVPLKYDRLREVVAQVTENKTIQKSSPFVLKPKSA